MEQSIEQRVKKIVAEQFGITESELTRESHFVNDLGADSLDEVELVMALEDELGLNVPNDEAEKIKTIGHAIEYAEKNVAA